ncbi:transcription initiation factor TFIID subunit 3 isoform X1 [Podarcis lilfordi]|uniref:Transcription initiation factor TFIID subunit 3 n=1 Tax=Podarcis lilfordi TaxID=74358 RepID=A0AA35PFM7_9SAUR|nr:transcription initiation factor TFIID subunit 3 isoform X1 [Podarcis lilfordi]
MCESYSRWLLRVSTAQVCQALGWDAVQLSACDLLTDVLQRYLHSLGRGCRRYCELYGRTDPILEDVGEAFNLMGVNLHELEDYILNIEPVTFAHQIPLYPVSKNNVLQFPQPGSKDAEERKEYIPDYMPPIVSSQEEEEEEQVPTDGGTSAEAMQVPLEEEGEMEEEEAVNDENYLSKRPLESPESEEMPATKRPKLASVKGDSPDGTVEPREPLSSINAQKVPPMLSPVCVQDGADVAPLSPEPPVLAPIAKSQLPVSKPLEPRAFTPKAKVKTNSPGQKTKAPKVPPSPAVAGSPIRSPKTGPKEKKSPGRSKSPRSPKSPKVPVHVPQVAVKQETPSRTPLAALSEKMGKENIQIKQGPTPVDPGKPNSENPAKKVAVLDKTIDDSIDAVIARACAERDPDPFEFSSGSESEGDVFTSPKRLSVSETTTPKASVSANSSLNKAGSTPVPPSGGTSSSDISWTMDDSIDEVIRKANMGPPANLPANFPYFSSPSASPPTPEPLLKVYEEKTKLASSVEVMKKLKKELKTKMKKKEKNKDKEKNKEKSKDKEKNKDKDKDKDGGKEVKFPWKDLIRDDDLDPYKFKIKDFDDEPKVKVKDGSTKKEREKHKDKKKDKGKKDKDKKDKEKVKEKNKGKNKTSSVPLVLPPKDLPLPLFSTPAAMKLPSLLPALPTILPEKLFEEKEKPKEKKKDKKEKKKKKEREKDKEKEKKEKEKEKKEREKKEKEKEKHKHEKMKVEPVVPAPSPVIPRLTLRVGAGQDKIVISKVVSAPEAKPSVMARPKTPPPPPSPAPAPVHVTPPPPPVVLPMPPAIISPAAIPPPSPAMPAVGGSKGPVRSVVTETVSNYVIRDEWGNKIWICPGCEKPDDGSAMIGCDDCDDWYHWLCVGITAAPPEEMQWFCSRCASKKKDKKHKKGKHRAH